MFLTDPIGDMFNRIRNGLGVKKEFVMIPFSRIKAEILQILFDKGFIGKFETINVQENKKLGAKNFIKVVLKYDEEGKSVISKMLRKSTPGRRWYVRKKDISKVLSGYGFNILSTSQGIMTGHDARKNNVGGELIAEVY